MVKLKIVKLKIVKLKIVKLKIVKLKRVKLKIYCLLKVGKNLTYCGRATCDLRVLVFPVPRTTYWLRIDVARTIIFFPSY
jgi:hypothetical protein